MSNTSAQSLTASQSVARHKRRYTLWVALMPTVIFAVVFASLCAYECTAAPWLTFLGAPVIAIIVGLLVIVAYLKRAAELGGEPGRSLRRYVLWSLVWGPLLASCTFYAALALLIKVPAVLQP